MGASIVFYAFSMYVFIIVHNLKVPFVNIVAYLWVCIGIYNCLCVFICVFVVGLQTLISPAQKMICGTKQLQKIYDICFILLKTAFRITGFVSFNLNNFGVKPNNYIV